MLRSIKKQFVLVVIFLVLHMMLSVGYYNALAVEQHKKDMFQNNMISVGGAEQLTIDLEEKLQKLSRLLESAEQNKIKAVDLNDQVSKLAQEIKELDQKVRKEFAETEAHLRQMQVAPEIIRRHLDFVAVYNENMQLLTAEISPRAINQQNFNQLHQQTNLNDTIQTKWLRKEFDSFEANGFPEKTPKFEDKEPRYYEPVTPAYMMTTPSQISQIQADDLQETIEIQITPEIKELARQLDFNPVKIYEYVRNNFDYELYYGSVRGSQETLFQKSGNDFDLASLLSALYRASDIPTRYVYGVVRVPFTEVKNWIGIQNDQAAMTAFATNGIPSRSVIVGGEPAYVEMEHVWVEAYISMNNYRGTTTDQNGKGWVALDPSFKQYTEVQGINLDELSPKLDVQALLDQLVQNASVGEHSITNMNEETLQQEMERVKDELITEFKAKGLTAEEIKLLGGREIIQEEYSILPISLPYQVNAVTKELTSLDDSFRQKMTIKITNQDYFNTTQFSYTATVPELAGKTIAINYLPATQNDANLIMSYANLTDNGDNTYSYSSYIPAYLVKMKPQLIIDGDVVATGGAITLGTAQNLQLNFSYPVYMGDPMSQVHKELTAGDQYAIVLNTGKIALETLNKHNNKLLEATQYQDQTDYSDITATDVAGISLNAIGMDYFAQVDSINEMIAQYYQIHQVRITSALVTNVGYQYDYMFGLPRGMTLDQLALSIDVFRDVHCIQSMEGDLEKEKLFNLVRGALGSYLEGNIFEQMVGGNEGISTMHVLRKANSLGIEIFSMNQTNVDQILPQLEYDSSKKQTFRNLINSGKTITVPKKEVTIGSWTGTGYQALDPDTGLGAYMISGGLNGGESDFDGDGFLPTPPEYNNDVYEENRWQADGSYLFGLFVGLFLWFAGGGWVVFTPWVLTAVILVTFLVGVLTYIANLTSMAEAKKEGIIGWGDVAVVLLYTFASCFILSALTVIGLLGVWGAIVPAMTLFWSFMIGFMLCFMLDLIATWYLAEAKAIGEQNAEWDKTFKNYINELYERMQYLLNLA